MPFARKSLIFGLHSIPADTTPVFLKNCMFSNFSLIKCFFAAPVAEKTKCGVNAATQPDFRFTDRLRAALRGSLPNKGRFIMNREKISLKAAQEGIVLLKNEDNILPLDKKIPVCIFGRGQNEFYKGGRGSGDVNSAYYIDIPSGIMQSGFKINEKLLSAYRKKGTVTKKLIISASEFSENAVAVISRNSTEFWDREIKNDFMLKAEEENLLLSLEKSDFKNIILILNIAGLIDFTFLKRYKKIKAVLLCFLPGMEGGRAIGDILCGKINPSGHLTDTAAYSYDDYPCAKNHHYFADTVYYEEDIFTGYRYFETVKEARDKVAFPFGHGLSYTDFRISDVKLIENGEEIEISFNVTNIGERSGKEVVQIYSGRKGAVNRPDSELRAFKKTRLLKPNETQSEILKIKKCELKEFDEEIGAWILKKGVYSFFIGNSIRNTVLAGSFEQKKDEILLKTGSLLNCKLPSRLLPDGSVLKENAFDKRDFAEKSCKCEFISPDVLSEKHSNHTLYDVADKKLSLKAFIKELSVSEKINLCQAQPPAIPRGTAGMGNNFERRIPNIQTADGPAGLRVSTPTTCFPCETLIACTWNPEIQYKAGKAMGEECAEHKIDILLAPALNIHRDPLCGRNFEYYSEDPYVSGKTAAEVVKGIQSTGTAATVKHFACNNQERFRIFSNSVVSETALREIYLRGFEYVVKESKPECLMTSYNLINGIRTSSNYSLLSVILRKEWGYSGVIMTDWRTDSHLFEEINAGNNVKMPFGYPDEIKLALDYASYGNLDLKQLDRSVYHILKLIMKTRRFKTKNFGPINKISGGKPSKFSALNLTSVSHTFAGIEKCSDIGGGESLRRLEKDMRGNDCFLTYILDFENSGEYNFSLRFSAEDSSSYIDFDIDGVHAGSFKGIDKSLESREWNEDDPADPRIPKKWTSSEKVKINVTSGKHELKLYIRTEKERRTMSLNFLLFEKI